MKYILTCTLLLLLLQLPAQHYQIVNNEVKIEKAILFKTGTDVLLPESDDALTIIKKYLDEKTYISQLRVECHADNTGNEAATQLLTEKRALAVCAKLVNMGVDCKRLLAVGFGSTKPVADNNSAEGRALNWRTCFFNAALRGKLIGGMPADGGGKAAGLSCN
ncbi:MAG: hypothetical protein RL172_3032 [Bacteroidota bacterium]|jgi:OmpA-OmpF porin, OOP family